MQPEDMVYRKLQQHLNRQPVGFPVSKSGAEIRILKHIFSPREAQIACFLDYKPESSDAIFKRVGHLVDAKERLTEILDDVEKKGGVETKIKDGVKYYCNAPLVVGMYEFQTQRLTPEFLRDFDLYTSEQKFGVEFLSTEVPQMRTIPIGKSLDLKAEVSTFDQAVSLLEQANGTFAILPCICREKKKKQDQTCKITDRTETCLAIGDFADAAIRNDLGRQIDLDEAIDILEKNQKQGMVLQPSNSQQADFICSCCGCCCGMLNIQKTLPKPVDFWVSNYFAAVDAAQCKGCGNCEKKCQVNAVTLPDAGQPAQVNPHRCIGCGLCPPVCPEKAITLRKKARETTPPQDREALYDLIMAKKKGPLGKLKVTGKVIFDAVSTGQAHLLKK